MVLPQWEAEFKENWSRGQYTDVSQYGTAILNAKAIGSCELINRIVTIDYASLCIDLGYDPPRKEEEDGE